MALQTTSKAEFLYDLMVTQNTDKLPSYTRDVRLKLYLNDTKVYIDTITVDILSQYLHLEGDDYEATTSFDSLPYELTYEFNY